MGANDPQHRAGQSVDTVDQTSSLALMGRAGAGAAAVVLLEWLLK